MIDSGLMADFSGLVSLSSPKLPLQLQRFKVTGFNGFKRVPLVSHQISGLRVLNSLRLQNNQIKCAVSSGRNPQELSFQDDFRSDPFWLTLIKEAMCGLRFLVVFLVEQPGQLRYIEWPSFQSTICLQVELSKKIGFTMMTLIFGVMRGGDNDENNIWGYETRRDGMLVWIDSRLSPLFSLGFAAAENCMIQVLCCQNAILALIANQIISLLKVASSIAGKSSRTFSLKSDKM
ncbi:hypothetical protein BVC80_8977g18 [Macleaya cordata]|uniref:Uncharacterized protein n=1 Tax=Macleaya cordata TaxID=56857 RepID=A0A200PYH7_MACCD|nr:hypothetical protein BVC80_8977g18 [Macleaya cordata]